SHEDGCPYSRPAFVGEVRGNLGYVSIVSPQNRPCIWSFDLKQRSHILRHGNVAQGRGSVGSGKTQSRTLVKHDSVQTGEPPITLVRRLNPGRALTCEGLENARNGI